MHWYGKIASCSKPVFPQASLVAMMVWAAGTACKSICTRWTVSQQYWKKVHIFTSREASKYNLHTPRKGLAKCEQFLLKLMQCCVHESCTIPFWEPNSDQVDSYRMFVLIILHQMDMLPWQLTKALASIQVGCIYTIQKATQSGKLGVHSYKEKCTVQAIEYMIIVIQYQIWGGGLAHRRPTYRLYPTYS